MDGAVKPKARFALDTSLLSAAKARTDPAGTSTSRDQCDHGGTHSDAAGGSTVILLHNNAANTQSVDFIRGTTTLTLTAWQTVIARLDGTANGLVSLLRGTV